MSSEKPLLVVIDTNVWISGIFWSGNPKQILNLVKRNQLTPVFSYNTFEELQRVLERASLLLARIDEAGIELKHIRRLGVFMEPQKQDIMSRDPNDAMFIDIALTSQSSYLITGDDDLLVLKTVVSTKIVTPKQFLKQYNMVMR